MDRSSFIRGLLDDPTDPQLPQYVPENDFGPRAYGLLNSLFPDPYQAAGDAVRQYRGGDAVGAFETMFGAMPTTGALSAARGRFGGAVMSPVDELFHGSPVQGLTTLTASERGPLGPGVYTSPSRQISGHYAGEGGHVYQVPHEGLDIYRGDGHRTDDQWFGYKDDQRRLIEAVPDEHKSAVVPVIEKMWSGDGYPLYQRIRGILGGDEQAQALFKKAGFHGISGQIDGPETLIFGNVPLKDAAPKAPGIIAYHGSPHSFDKFDLSKIGTGEGAQAYGHGLYFAESEPVAKAYRDNLASPTLKTPGGEIFDPQTQLKHLNVRVAARNNGSDLDATIARAQQLLPKGNEQTRPLLEQDLETLMRLKEGGGVAPNKGSMYQVRINADPNAFLDWDKPLSEQSPVVQDRLSKRVNPELSKAAAYFGIGGDEVEALSTAQQRGLISDYFTQAPAEHRAVDWSPTGEAIYGQLSHSGLREAGIPGIKYLDAGSRGSGEGSRNYVVFDDSLIDILKKYGLIGLLGGGAAASGVSGMNTPPYMPNSAPGL